MHVNYLYWLMNSVDPNMQESISILTNLKSLEQGLVDWKSLEEPQGKRWGQKVSSYMQWMNLETRWCHSGGTIASKLAWGWTGLWGASFALITQSLIRTTKSTEHLLHSELTHQDDRGTPFQVITLQAPFCWCKKKINTQIIGGGLLMTVNHKIL